MKTLPQKPKSIWVQTDRKAHEAWARLIMKVPTAGALMHVLSAQVGDHNAVVISQRTLTQILGVSKPTIIKAIKALKDGNWIDVRQIGGSGTTNAYILNDRAAWTQSRDKLRYSLFSANVILNSEEQPDQDQLDDLPPLRKIPKIGELQIPTGEGLPPPSQPSLEGLEPDLPAAGQSAQTDLEDFTGRPDQKRK